MFRYEILILTIPEITKDEVSTLEFQIDKLIKQINGSIISFERWGKYRLAYPVTRNDYGVYFLIRFEVEDKRTIVKDLNSLFSVKFSGIVVRNVVRSFAANQSLEYQKPPSLEDTPRRHISSFLEEKGLLRKNKIKQDKPEAEATPTEVAPAEEPAKEASASKEQEVDKGKAGETLTGKEPAAETTKEV